MSDTIYKRIYQMYCRYYPEYRNHKCSSKMTQKQTIKLKNYLWMLHHQNKLRMWVGNYITFIILAVVDLLQIHKIYHTSDWSSLIISYISKSTNNFSGDLLLLAIASPKLRSMDTLFAVTSAKHWSLREWTPSSIWSQIFLSPAKSSFTCF